MKYSEFKAEVEKLGFDVNVKNLETRVRRKGKGNSIMTVDAQRKCIVDTTWDEFQYLRDDAKEQLFNLGYKLAKTPLAEREEEKKYWLRFTTPTLLKNFIPDGYLNIHRESNELSLSSDKKDTEYFKTIFTESEIAKMDITGFCKEEVK